MTEHPFDYIDTEESYSCKPYTCRPDVQVLEHQTLAFTVYRQQTKWLPNDKAWLWTCPHGRSYFLRWEGSMTMKEFEEAISG